MNSLLQSFKTAVYVTGFGKTCIVHTSDFARLEIHKNHREFRCETFRNDKWIVVLQSVKVLHLSIILNRFYESPKSKNWMCELCTFSQIQSHIRNKMELFIYKCKCAWAYTYVYVHDHAHSHVRLDKCTWVYTYRDV